MLSFGDGLVSRPCYPLFVYILILYHFFFFFFQAEDGIRDADVTGVQTCALPIYTWIVEGKQIVMVAHSQGNLFANSAYDYAASQTDAESLKLVHIAPATPIANGPHRLADKDLVINALRATGGVQDITDIIPAYLDRPAGLNGETDILGHGLLEIYLNPALNIGAAVVGDIENELAAVQP